MSFSLSADWQIIHQGAEYLITPSPDKHCIDFFDPQFWLAHDAVINTAHGRGTTYFVKHNDEVWVLRSYLRGGLVGRFIKRRFVYTGITRTRVYRELALLEHLHQAGVNVPRAIAGYIHRSNSSYECKLLLEAIPHAREIHALCQNGTLTEAHCQTIGEMIAKMHHAGVYHHDLNIQNILLDADAVVWLIDFDKCHASHTLTTSQKHANLKRLRRSIEKQKRLHPHYFFPASHWEALLVAYEHAN